MTERLYYHNSFLLNFTASVKEMSVQESHVGVVLDRTAFYPASGGQLPDAGWLEVWNDQGAPPKLHVVDVSEQEDGSILHVLESGDALLRSGVRVRGFIDEELRRDHMQQHTGQHVLSAAFVALFAANTVSFHMGQETCTIDLEVKTLSPEQVRRAEALANDIIFQDRAVEVRYASADEARSLGVRKIPEAAHEKLRLIDIKDFDLNACGGTHVRSTGQIGAILVRKLEKVKQGIRVEFVCGNRAVRTARHDYETLTQAAELFSTHPDELAAQITKLIEEGKSGAKREHRLLEEIADLAASQMLFAVTGEPKVVVAVQAERDLAFIKLLAQKITKQSQAVALLGCGGEQPAIVFAQTPGLPYDMNQLMKEALAELGGRGGGNKDMAQGGGVDGAKIEAAIRRLAEKLR